MLLRADDGGVFILEERDQFKDEVHDYCEEKRKCKEEPELAGILDIF